MSHKFVDGFCVGTVSWHQLETLVASIDDVIDALKKSGSNWNAIPVPVSVDGKFSQEYKGIIREDTRQVLGIVKKNYHIVQNSELASWMQDFVDTGKSSWASAGVLDDSKIVYYCSAINGSTKNLGNGKDDPVQLYLAISQGHAGRRKITITISAIRHECWNKLLMAESSAESLTKIKHHVGASARLTDAFNLMHQKVSGFEVQFQQLKKMTDKRMSRQEFREYLLEVFPPTKRKIQKAENFQKEKNYLVTLDDIIDAREKRTIDDLGITIEGDDRREFVESLLSKTHKTIDDLFENGKGADIHPGTLYQGYQAVTEYLDHHRGREAGSAMLSSMMDDTIRQTAFDAAVSRI